MVRRFNPMMKKLAQLIDELSVTNIKIFMLVDKVQRNEHTLEDAKKIQDLNKFRAELMNAINDDDKIVKL
jgi:predicted deacetylase